MPIIRGAAAADTTHANCTRQIMEYHEVIFRLWNCLHYMPSKYPTTAGNTWRSSQDTMSNEGRWRELNWIYQVIKPWATIKVVASYAEGCGFDS